MNYAGFDFHGHDLSKNDLTLYDQACGNRQVTLINHGTLDDCIKEEVSEGSIVLLQNSSAVKLYGIGFLNPPETYGPQKVVSLDNMRVIAGYGSIYPWEDFVRRVKLEKLKEMMGRSREIIIFK